MSMSLFLLIIFFAMSMLGVPLAVALGLAGVATLLLFTPMPFDLLTQTMFSSMNSFLLVAVPLFILVGAVMERGRVAERIFDFAEAMVGWLPGGLGHVNVISSVIFSGVSGSSVADIASVGAIEIKAMERHGFPKGYAVGMTLCTATLSSIIPPSILVVIAGSIANVSIGTLLVAGLVPGLFIAFAFMVFNHFYSVHYGYNPPSPFVLRTVIVTGLSAILPMLTPVILVVGIASGVFTPTEAAAVAVVYVMVLAMLVYRTIPLSEIPGDPDLDGAHLRHDPVHRRHLAARRLDLRFRRPARQGRGAARCRERRPDLRSARHLRLPADHRHLHGSHPGDVHPHPRSDAAGVVARHRSNALPGRDGDDADPRPRHAAGRRLPVRGGTGRQHAGRGRHSRLAGADGRAYPRHLPAGALPGPDARTDPPDGALSMSGPETKPGVEGGEDTHPLPRGDGDSRNREDRDRKEAGKRAGGRVRGGGRLPQRHEYRAHAQWHRTNR